MRFSQVLRTALSNLKSNKMRTILTIAGISVGIAAIVFLVSLGYGLQNLSIKKIAGLEAIRTLEVSAGRQGTYKLDKKMVEQIKAMSNVDTVSPTMLVGAKTESEGKKTDLVVNLVNEDFFALDGTKMAYGGLFSNTDKDKVIASSALAKVLGSDPASFVNKEIILSIVFMDSKNVPETVKSTFKVVGIITDDSTSYAYAPLLAFSDKILDTTVYNSLKVKVADQSKLGDVRKNIEDLGFTVTSIADTISQVNQIFKIIQIVLALFGVIALLVAAIGMFNTMTIALLERTRDIGIMKAIGVYNIDVAKIFLSESAMIATMGGVFGTAVGLLTGYVINLVINLLAKSVGGGAQTLFYTPWWLAAGIIAFSVLVGFSTGFYPSKRASKLNPLDALRYE